MYWLFGNHIPNPIASVAFRVFISPSKDCPSVGLTSPLEASLLHSPAHSRPVREAQEYLNYGMGLPSHAKKK